VRIESSANYLYASQLTRTSQASDARAGTAGAAASDSAGNTGVKRADFSSMTRKELADWVNGMIKSGQMSLDESTTFVSMTLKIPVDAAQGQAMGLDDQEKVNFFTKAQQGIGGALANHDERLLAELQSVIQTMQQHQGDAFAIDLRA
jgi:hypothetical protein